jgi:hypothetical protein
VFLFYQYFLEEQQCRKSCLCYTAHCTRVAPWGVVGVANAGRNKTFFGSLYISSKRQGQASLESRNIRAQTGKLKLPPYLEAYSTFS